MEVLKTVRVEKMEAWTGVPTAGRRGLVCLVETFHLTAGWFWNTTLWFTVTQHPCWKVVFGSFTVKIRHLGVLTYMWRKQRAKIEKIIVRQPWNNIVFYCSDAPQVFLRVIWNWEKVDSLTTLKLHLWGETRLSYRQQTRNELRKRLTRSDRDTDSTQEVLRHRWNINSKVRD